MVCVGSAGHDWCPKRMVYVEIDPRKLDAYHMGIEQIGNVIAAENMNMPAGNIKMGMSDYQLRVQGVNSATAANWKILLWGTTTENWFIYAISLLSTIRSRTAPLKK